jgi:hypothetical protein
MTTPTQFNTSTGLSVPTGDTSGTPEQQTAFMNNISQMLQDAQNQSLPQKEALLAQSGSLDRIQQGMGQVSSNNPLAFLYNMAPNSAKAGMYDASSHMFDTGISNINDTIKLGDQRIQNVANVISGQKDTIAAQQSLAQTKIAQTQADIAKFQATHVYNPAKNPLTQMPYGWSTSPDSIGNDQTSSNSRMVGTINTSAYGAKDPQYDSKLASHISAIKSQMPSGYDPVIADNILKYNKSPLTSQMFSLVADHYGLNTIDFMGQIGLETQYGTTGEATKDNHNPGGVVWANQQNATQGSPRPANEGGFYAKYKTDLDGLYAAAEISSTPTSITTTPPQNTQPNAIANTLTVDAKGLADGSLAPQVLQDRYDKADMGGLYVLAIQLAKQINPDFDETKANLKYAGQQTNVENLNSGNPITSLFSNAKNLMSQTTPSILSPAKPQGSTYNGITLPN